MSTRLLPLALITSAISLAQIAHPGAAHAQAATPPPAQTPAHGAHDMPDMPDMPGVQDHEAHHGTPLPALCAICPAGRESAGTAWQPDSTPAHARIWTIGDWQVLAHLQLAVVATDERGPRGDDGLFTTDFGMVEARRRAGRGVIGIQSMWSLEPFMGRRGYPLLLETGETADGVTALVDRQHPHDLPMELAVTYSRPFDVDRAFFVYAAAVGAPALGPPAFMHRASASDLPIAPITHHWFDSSHVSYGVVTLGLIVSPTVKFEGSAFRGREPDQHRWGFEQPRLDSYAFRLSVNPTPHVALQVSGGMLHDAEQLHPGADLTRVTASVMYSGRLAGVPVDAMAAWGRNKRSATSFPVQGGIYFMPGSLAQAALGEATFHVARRQAIVTRLEHAEKDELFDIEDPRHAILYPATRLTAGYVVDVRQTSAGTLGVGAAWSWSHVDAAIRDVYGGSPQALLAFVRVIAH